MGKIIKKGMACILLLGLCVALIWIVPGEDESWEGAKESVPVVMDKISVLDVMDEISVPDVMDEISTPNVMDEISAAMVMNESGEEAKSESAGEEESVGESAAGSVDERVEEIAADSNHESREEATAGSADERVEENAADSFHESREEATADNNGEDERKVDTGILQEDPDHRIQENPQENSDHKIQVNTQANTQEETQENSEHKIQEDTQANTQEETQENPDHSVQEDPQENTDHSTREDISGTAGENIEPGDICQSQGHVFKVSIWENPTCLKGGYYNNICERCGLVECVTQPALSHEIEDITIQEGNCMEDTIIRHRCKHCGQQIKSDTRFTPQIHQWGSALVDGQQVIYCEWCGVTQ